MRPNPNGCCCRPSSPESPCGNDCCCNNSGLEQYAVTFNGPWTGSATNCTNLPTCCDDLGNFGTHVVSRMGDSCTWAIDTGVPACDCDIGILTPSFFVMDLECQDCGGGICRVRATVRFSAVGSDPGETTWVNDDFDCQNGGTLTIDQTESCLGPSTVTVAPV